MGAFLIGLLAAVVWCMLVLWVFVHLARRGPR